MAEKISWHPPDAALRPASQFECALRRRRKIGFCPPTARRLRVAMLGLSARPSAAPLSTYRKVPRLGERVQEPTAVLKVAFLLWLFDFLIFEQFWWNGEGGEGLAQELPGGKDNIGGQGEEIGEEAGSLCGCLSCGAPRRVEALEERMPGEGEKV